MLDFDGTMPDFRSIAARLFPSGTNPGSVSRDMPPDWPPDLFAFASVVVESFGIYAEEEFTAGWDKGHYHFGPDFQTKIEHDCTRWTSDGVAPSTVWDIWKRLTRPAKNLTGTKWRKDIVFLMVLADEASRGAGFEIRSGSGGFVAQLVFEQLAKLQDRKPVLLPYLPNSLCLMVPAEQVCVQPKTNTPQVGCTLRSMSHHLCLLPSTGVVKTSWTYAAPAKTPTQHFNVLAVPFPYKIEGSDFEPLENPSDPKNFFFCVGQGWLSRRNRAATATSVSQFILALVTAAEVEAESVHAIVLPELALPGGMIEDVVRRVAKEKPKLELFVAGILDELPGRRYRNCAFTAVLLEGEVVQHWRQPKHHRWRLEESQIARYDLGFVLEPERNWWEAIDVSGRSCTFTVVRPSTSVATLICEDLARFDPLMPVINSVGPNLLFALLMDGPQMERRWPGRYATVLADDPGTSVLSLTSMGMIERSNEAGHPEQRQVALWKEPGHVARELTLPRGHHALILSLTMGKGVRQSLDMRSEESAVCRFRLSGVRPISLLSSAKFGWTDI